METLDLKEFRDLRYDTGMLTLHLTETSCLFPVFTWKM